MKKFVVLTALAALFLFLSSQVFQWRFNPSRLPGSFDLPSEEEQQKMIEEAISSLNDDNAAKYYLQATLHLVEPEEKDLLWDAVDKGWQEPPLDLRSLIEQNEPVFELVHEGTEKPYSSVKEIRGVTYFADFRQIARLMLVKAMILNAEGRREEVKETLLDLLQFGVDVSRMGAYVQTLVGKAIEGLSLDGIVHFIQKAQDEQVLEDLLNKLIEMNKERVSPDDVLRTEFADHKKWFHEYGNAILYHGTDILNLTFSFEELQARADKSPNSSLEKRRIFKSLVDSCDRAGGYAWFRLTEQRHLKQMDDIYQKTLEASQKSCAEAIRELRKMTPNDKITQRWFSPTFSGVLVLARDETTFRATLLRAALRLHFLKNGRYPETLDELAPLVPGSFLIDPFSMEHFKYRKTDEGYMFYSVGPDLTDNGAAGAPSSRPPGHGRYDILYDQSGSVTFMEPAS